MTTDRKNIIDEDILYVFDMEEENRAFSRKSVLACAGDEYFGDDYFFVVFGFFFFVVVWFVVFVF